MLQATKVTTGLQARAKELKGRRSHPGTGRSRSEPVKVNRFAKPDCSKSPAARSDQKGKKKKAKEDKDKDEGVVKLSDDSKDRSES